MAVDHIARAREAWPHLVVRAKSQSAPFTYGEISKLIGVHHRAAQYFLGVIQKHCEEAKLPPLQSLAVNKATRLPGEGYRGSAITPAAHAAALRKVYAKEDWPSKPPF